MRIPFFCRDIWINRNSIYLAHKRPSVMYGLVNELPLPYPDRFFFISDYDNWSEEDIKDEAERLVLAYPLYIIYVLRTSKRGYHFVSPTRLRYHQFIDILQSTPCDRNFFKICVSEHKGVLRYTQKKGLEPKHFYTAKNIRSPMRVGNISTSVMKFLNVVYGIPISQDMDLSYDAEPLDINVRKYNIRKV